MGHIYFVDAHLIRDPKVKALAEEMEKLRVEDDERRYGAAQADKRSQDNWGYKR